MSDLCPERVWLSCWAYARCSKAGRCGRGEAAHPQTELDTKHAVDALRGARQPWQRRSVNCGPRADAKRTDAKQGDLARGLTGLSQAPSAPKSADLTKTGTSREQDGTSLTNCTGSLVGMCAWVGRRWHHQFNSKCDAGSPRLPQHKEAVGTQRWESAKAHVCAVRGHVGHAP